MRSGRCNPNQRDRFSDIEEMTQRRLPVAQLPILVTFIDIAGNLNGDGTEHHFTKPWHEERCQPQQVERQLRVGLQTRQTIRAVLVPRRHRQYPSVIGHGRGPVREEERQLTSEGPMTGCIYVSMA
ncbi:hypothetical protein GCM10011247_07350 [Pseudomonas plecoglossicida]|nr:hypothetical protein GCM10011247_07350 [Pseudomonas plecoglossicida]